MNKKIFLSLLFILVISAKNENDNINASRESSITRAIELVSSSVVGVNVTKIKKQRSNPFLDPFWDDFFPQTRSYKVESFGSGVIYNRNGYIITNEHVIKNASEIYITTNDGEKHKAELIGVDELTDIALLKINISNLNPIVLGDSDDLIIGEWVVALGNPLGLFTLSNHVSATAGIVSAMNMDFGKKESGRVYQNMIQTDASINPGNSGGPLVNSLGEVIGINTFIMTNSNYNEGSIGIGFAIPINLVKEIVGIIKNEGEVNRNYFTGIHIQDIDVSIKKYLNLSSNYGVIITEVEPNSSGYRSGLIVGDVILEVDGRKVKDSSDIFRIIDEGLRKTGDNIKLTILRNGIDMEISLKLEGKKSTWWKF